MESTSQIRILLVDDHASTRVPLAFMLDQEPDLAITAQAGSIVEATATIGQGGIDVAIIDLGLPDGSGEELIAPLRTACPNAQSLILTYFSDRERLAAAIAAGAAGILHKSSPVEDVMEAVRQLHRGEQLLSLHEIVAAIQLLDRERRRGQEIERLASELTTREREVLNALAEGLSDREIAARFSVGPATVRTHVTHILDKLDAQSRLQALVTAIRHGIVNVG